MFEGDNVLIFFVHIEDIPEKFVHVLALLWWKGTPSMSSKKLVDDSFITLETK